MLFSSVGKNRKKSIAPRDALAGAYGLEGELPSEISDSIFPQQLTKISEMVHDGSGYHRERRAVSRLMRDACITAEQKAEIAEAILDGRYRVLDPKPAVPRTTTASAEECGRLKMTHLTVKRHDLQKPVFLEIKTDAAEIPRLNPKEQRSKLVGLLRQNSRPNTTEYTRLRSTLKTAPVTSQVKLQHQLTDSMDSYMGSQGLALEADEEEGFMSKSEQMRLAKLDRLKKLQQDRVEAALSREQALRQKELLRQSTEKKVEIKKKLNNFRKQMKEFLVKQKHPLMGPIMRCVDESMVYHFMERYDGFSMTVQAILALIGDSLGISLLVPEFPLEEDLEAEEARALAAHVTANERAFRDPVRLHSTAEHHSRHRPRSSIGGGGALVSTSYDGAGLGQQSSHDQHQHQLQGDSMLRHRMEDAGHTAVQAGRGQGPGWGAPGPYAGRAVTTAEPYLKLRRPRSEKKFRPHPLAPLVTQAASIQARQIHQQQRQAERAATAPPLVVEEHDEVYARSGRYRSSPKHNSDAVVGISARAFSKDNRPPSPEKSFGGGFRATSPDKIRAKHDPASGPEDGGVGGGVVGGGSSASLMGRSGLQQRSHTTFLPAPSRLLDQHSRSHATSSYASSTADDDPAAAGEPAGGGFIYSSEMLRRSAENLDLIPSSGSRGKANTRAGSRAQARRAGGVPLSDAVDNSAAATGSAALGLGAVGRLGGEWDSAGQGGDYGSAAPDSGRSQGSLHSRHSDMSYEEMMARAASPTQAMAVMHEQLIEEGLLPAMQPERVLSEEQLQMLGSIGVNKTAFESIMQQVAAGQHGGGHLVAGIASGSGALESASERQDEQGKVPDKDRGGADKAEDADEAKDAGDNIESEGAPTDTSNDAGAVSRPASKQSDAHNRLEPAFIDELSSRPYLTQFDIDADAEWGPVKQQPPSPGSAAQVLHSRIPLHGSVLSPLDRLRLDQVAAQEAQRGQQRLMGTEGPLAGSPEEMMAFAMRPLSAPGSRAATAKATPASTGAAQGIGLMSSSVLSPLNAEGLLAAPPLATLSPSKAGTVGGKVENHNAGRAPLGIKTREGPRDAFDSSAPAPVSPFKSYHDQQAVLNSGVPAGAGLMLWRPRSRATRQGRFRVGQGFRSKHQGGRRESGPSKKPFVSAT